MSEKCLDVKVYNSANPPSINWSNCELRTWLTGSESGSFLNTAFTSAQQGEIFDTTVSAPYAILSPWNENMNESTSENMNKNTNGSIVASGDNTWIWVTGIYAVLVISAGVLVLMCRKKQLKT